MSEDDWINCECSEDWVRTSYDFQDTLRVDAPNYPPVHSYSCSNGTKTYVYWKYIRHYGSYEIWDKYTYGLTCQANPCDTSTQYLNNLGACEDIPGCDGVGQDGWDSNGEVCKCQDGLCPVDGSSCAVPECPQYYSFGGDCSSPCVPDNPDDIDGDGIPNASDPDIDGNGTPNWEDDDIDGDGIPNSSDASPGGGGDGGGDVPEDEKDGDGDGTETAECGAGSVYSNSAEACICLNGGTYPSCTVPECPISYGGLTLRSQNVSNSACISSYPPSNG